MADEDVVFVNSPLYKHLSEVGFTDYDAQAVNGKKAAENNYLVVYGGRLSWEGSLQELKQFTCSVLKLTGKWRSPGGDVKIFSTSNEESIFKWQGLKRKRIEIVKDRENELLNCLKSHARQENSTNESNAPEDPIDHVLSTAMSLPLSSLTCSECGKHETSPDHAEIEVKFELVLARLNKLEENAQNEKMAETLLTVQNSKMAAEIEHLKATVSKLQEENEGIWTLLDMKQSQWIQVESRKSKKATTKTTPQTQITNRFNVLAVEEEEQVADVAKTSSQEDSISTQISEYRAKQKRNYHKINRKKQRNPQLPSQQSVEKKTLVIGDSMVKNIDDKKLERAARTKTVCHSYSGATVTQLHDKYEENDHEEKYESIIVHVGTNDLAHEDADKVAEKMDTLIEEYDGRIPASKICSYNNLLYNLCLSERSINRYGIGGILRPEIDTGIKVHVC